MLPPPENRLRVCGPFRSFCAASETWTIDLARISGGVSSSPELFSYA